MESNSSSVSAENPWPYLSGYVKFISKLGEQILFECKLCLPNQTKIKAHTSSLNNLKQHMKRVHESQYLLFEETTRTGSKRGRPKRRIAYSDKYPNSGGGSSLKTSAKKRRQGIQTSIGESFGVAVSASCVPQVRVEQCITNFFISNMIPVHVVESKSFCTLIKTLNPNTNSISRRTLGIHVMDKHIQLKQRLINLLGKIEWVATTADCWSDRNKSYLGMTVHWLDPITRARMQAVLACIRLKGHHTYNTIAKTMIDVHYEFQIDKKITRITTDNGSNFFKAFVQFGTEADSLPDVSSCNFESESDKDVASFLKSNSEEDAVEFISVENILSSTNTELPNCSRCNGTDEDILQNFNCLPAHMRCAAHTFNLVASKDADAALQVSVFKTPYKIAIAKAHTLWNQQSRSTVAADIIYSELGSRLVVPTTNWKSMYDAIVILTRILESNRTSLHRVMTQLKIPTINDQDVLIMNEYAKVMTPIANALDRIQGDDQAYIGSLLPTVAATVLKLRNIKSKGLVHCTALADALLNGIEKRFGPLLDDEHCQLAAAFHPKFRLIWLEIYDNSRVNAVTKCMEAKVEEALQRSNERVNIGADSNASNNDDDEEDFFTSVTQFTIKSENYNCLKNKAQSLVTKWLAMKSKDTFNDSSFLEDDIILNLFIKYNTAIPSSAAVERLFSTSSSILQPQRASISDEYFNILMFMKGNMHIMSDE